MADKSGGMDRREFLRRSAIVGGTVAWMTPVIQSLAPPAYAHSVSPATNCCCQCIKTSDGSHTKCSILGEHITSDAACNATCPTGSVGTRHCGPNPFDCGGPPNKTCTSSGGHDL